MRKTWMTLAIALCAGALIGACDVDDGDTHAAPAASTAEVTPRQVVVTPNEVPLLFAGSEGSRAAGTYAISKFTRVLRISIPDGWSTFGDFALIAPGGFEAGYVSFWKVDDVNLDACRWHGTAGIGQSATELITALADQTSTGTTHAIAIDVDGQPAHEVVLSVDRTLDVGSCDERIISPWFEADGDSRVYTAPGEREVVRVIDLGVDAALISYRVPEEMTPALLGQIDSMLASIEIA